MPAILRPLILLVIFFMPLLADAVPVYVGRAKVPTGKQSTAKASATDGICPSQPEPGLSREEAAQSCWDAIQAHVLNGKLGDKPTAGRHLASSWVSVPRNAISAIPALVTSELANEGTKVKSQFAGGKTFDLAKNTNSLTLLANVPTRKTGKTALIIPKTLFIDTKAPADFGLQGHPGLWDPTSVQRACKDAMITSMKTNRERIFSGFFSVAGPNAAHNICMSLTGRETGITGCFPASIAPTEAAPGETCQGDNTFKF